MRCRYIVRALVSEGDWAQLRGAMSDDQGKLLPSLLDTLRGAGGAACVEESIYIDRDFSSSYAAFYATLYRPYTKYCRRFHFFRCAAPDLEHVKDDAGRLAAWIEERRGSYLGYVVIRPVRHAPVSRAVLSASDVAPIGTEISVRCAFTAHVLGVALGVTGFPITEQDTRTGACAQAAIWTAGRFLHHRHSAPWFSMTQITEAAMRPADSDLMRSLPAGSDYLTGDSMVRALRAMGEHPKVYGRDPETNRWEAPPSSIVARYVDSGVPVIIGLSGPSGVGHAVVAVGMGRTAGLTREAAEEAGRSIAGKITHFVVNDDQRGAYKSLPVKRDVAGPDALPFAMDEDVEFILIPLPDKVFMTAEIAEEIAWDKIRSIAAGRQRIVERAVGRDRAATWEFDQTFYDRLEDGLVARTYLTSGWKYKQRTLRNRVPTQLKQELRLVQLPRYVWVTEFSLPEDNAGHDPCDHAVRAHVIVDATGSRFWESVILAHLPGIVVVSTFDVEAGGQASETVLRVVRGETPYLPKVRGWDDYSTCPVPAAIADPASGHEPRRPVAPADAGPGPGSAQG